MTDGLFRRTATGVSLFLALQIFGVVGYMLVEGWSFLDALYMTITTVTTVGFREVQPLSTGGKIFTLFLIIFGVGVALFVLTAVVQVAVEGEVGRLLGVRRMKGKIAGLSNHYILCGFGRVGEEIAREFAVRRVPFVVIESNPEALARLRPRPYLYVEGDATTDAVLTEAGIERAGGLLAASDSDSGNTYITLTAKALNPKVFVVARAGRPANEAKMRRAGAERVISPYLISGRRMALSALQPLMVDFIDTLATGRHGEQLLAELEITPDSAIAGCTLREALSICPGATALGIQKRDGALVVGPRPDQLLSIGDRLMVFGEEEELERLSRVVPSATAPAPEGAETPPASFPGRSSP